VSNINGMKRGEGGGGTKEGPGHHAWKGLVVVCGNIHAMVAEVMHSLATTVTLTREIVSIVRIENFRGHLFT